MTTASFQSPGLQLFPCGFGSYESGLPIDSMMLPNFPIGAVALMRGQILGLVLNLTNVSDVAHPDLTVLQAVAAVLMVCLNMDALKTGGYGMFLMVGTLCG